MLRQAFAFDNLFARERLERGDDIAHVCILGGRAIGKSQLRKAFCGFDYSENYIPTRVVEFGISTAKKAQKTVKIQVIVSSSEPCLQGVIRVYCEQIDVFLIWQIKMAYRI